ncbi:fungal specific transcription factor domain-containing protein [Stagonosporopsis vannaccii]|nr:fungal specific transcription factor domain-containing protein [Stagonosporopsis vannaccii]
MTNPTSPMRSMFNIQAQTAPLSSTSTANERKSENAQPRVRRRNRIISSCLECRRRKLKCDKGQPCANCVKVSRQCLFISPSFDAAAQARLAEVKEKMGILERSLENDVSQRSRAQNGLSANNDFDPVSRQEMAYGEEEEDDDTKNLRSSDFATEDNAYYEDEYADDDIIDLGIALGKLRITERIGGLVRPKFSDELGQALEELPKREQNSISFPAGTVDWMMPSNDYVAPSSSFFFTPGAERATFMNYLPAKVLVDKLMAHYWQAVHVVARTVHRPSFERHYEKFWVSVASGIEPRNSFQAVVFAALLSSVISMPSSKILSEFGVDKQGLVDNFREATEAALSRANLLATTKLETLQAFVMYLIPLCRAEVSRAHSALAGTCIRLAECMGLHKDPSAYSTSPIECQVRRLIWHQICFLDLRTCEATGPRCQIRPDDYDTRLPLNIDDVDLDQAEQGDGSVDVQTDRTYFTDMTITRMRFECYDMHRYLWVERPKLERKPKEGEKKVTISFLLARIQTFTAAMEKTYLPMLNKTAPLHALASLIYSIISNRLYIQILQKYLSSERHKMPDRLRQIVLSASIMILENSQTIEQQPVLSTWSWYVGALHQYHTALLVLNELYAQEYTPDMEQRAWRVLDFVFELGPGMTNQEKTRAVLEELIRKLQVYSRVKRWRAPKDMPHAGPRTHTPGFQLQQQQKEEQTRNNSLHSIAGGNVQAPFGSMSPPPPPPPPPQQSLQKPSLHQEPSRSSSSSAISFPGAMPHADWGTFDMALPTSNSVFQQPSSVTDLYAMPNSPTATPASNSMPLPRVISQGSDPTSFTSPRITLSPGAPTSTARASPMNALNDIDWNEIDQLFGDAETGTGNMMIPPFTFPQFSAIDLSDLQWPREGYA